MFKSQEIADLQNKITKLEADLKASSDNAVAIQSQLDQAKIDLATAQTEAGKVASLTARLEDQEKLSIKLTAERDEARASLVTAKADFETKVNAEVTTRLAAAGVDPIKRDPKAKTDDTGKPKADASLPPRQRAAAAMESSFKVFGKKD